MLPLFYPFNNRDNLFFISGLKIRSALQIVFFHAFKATKKHLHH